jgi:hypothetical protein
MHVMSEYLAKIRILSMSNLQLPCFKIVLKPTAAFLT